jgi:hypothetical protein
MVAVANMFQDLPVPITEGFAMREYMDIKRCQHKLKDLRNLDGQDDLRDEYEEMIATSRQNILEEYASQRQEAIDQLGPCNALVELVKRCLGRFDFDDETKARWNSSQFLLNLQIALDDITFGKCWCQEDVQGPAATFCGCGQRWQQNVVRPEAVTVLLQ